MSLDPGTLKRPITINQASMTKDAAGQPQLSGWTQVLSTWASIRTVTSKEVYAMGAGFDAQISHKITIRYQPSITVTSGMQVGYMGRVFIIQAVSDPTEERVQLDLMCLEQSK